MFRTLCLTVLLTSQISAEIHAGGLDALLKKLGICPGRLEQVISAS